MSSKMNSTATFKWLAFALLLLWVSFAFFGCSTLPKLDRPVTLYKGCPEFGGICKKLKAEVKQDLQPAMPNISPAALDEWVEINIDETTKVKLLPAKAPSFKEYIAIHASDMGVILKYINDLKRKIAGK